MGACASRVGGKTTLASRSCLRADLPPAVAGHRFGSSSTNAPTLCGENVKVLAAMATRPLHSLQSTLRKTASNVAAAQWRGAWHAERAYWGAFELVHGHSTKSAIHREDDLIFAIWKYYISIRSPLCLRVRRWAPVLVLRIKGTTCINCFYNSTRLENKNLIRLENDHPFMVFLNHLFWSMLVEQPGHVRTTCVSMNANTSIPIFRCAQFLYEL